MGDENPLVPTPSRLPFAAMLLPDNIALVHDWLAAAGELLVNFYFPHTAGGETSYLIRSLTDLKRALSTQAHSEMCIHICRTLPYAVRGAATQELATHAARGLGRGSGYAVASLDRYYPEPVEHWRGETVDELESDLAQLRGRIVGVATEPLPWELPVQSLYMGPQSADVLYLQVTRNKSYYENLRTNPTQYAQALTEWTSS